MTTPVFTLAGQVLWAGRRPILTAKTRKMDHGKWFIRHVWLCFPNGWGLSVVWGTDTYSDAQCAETPTSVEVAMLAGNQLAGTDIAGWVTVDQFCALVDAVAGWPSGEVGQLPDFEELQVLRHAL